MIVYTVTYTSHLEEPESIPWIISHVSLRSAKLHVIEEAFIMSVQYGCAAPTGEWLDKPEYSQFTQHYSSNHRDEWLIVQTELVEDDSYLERNSLDAYNQLFRMLDGGKES